MAKGWTKLNTVNDIPTTNATEQEKVRKARRVDNFIRSTKSLKVEELKKAGDEHYAQQVSKEDALLDAFENKRLKSKELIKQAIKIKKDRAKVEAKKAAEVQSSSKQNEKKDPEPAPAE